MQREMQFWFSLRDDKKTKYIAITILSIKDRWPTLTVDEKKEIEVASYAIYYFDKDVDNKGLLDGVEFPECLTLYQNRKNDNAFKKFIKLFRK